MLLILTQKANGSNEAIEFQIFQIGQLTCYSDPELINDFNEAT